MSYIDLCTNAVCHKVLIKIGRDGRISRGTNNCVLRVFEKNIYFIMRFSPIFNCFSSMKGYIFVIFCFKNKISKGLIMQVYFHSLI